MIRASRAFARFGHRERSSRCDHRAPCHRDAGLRHPTTFAGAFEPQFATALQPMARMRDRLDLIPALQAIGP